jgi:leucyl aminopeptidase
MFIESTKDAVALNVVSKSELQKIVGSEPRLQKYVALENFDYGEGKALKQFSEDFELEKVYVVLDEAKRPDPKRILEIGGRVAKQLKKGSYFLNWDSDSDLKNQFALGWGLSQYNFDQFVSKDEEVYVPELVTGDDTELLQAELESLFMAKDLVNSPANHMNPEHLEKVVQELAEDFDAEFSVIRGDQLVSENFPAIYEVGKGSSVAPRLIELNWGKESDPKVCIVGKGVCFDAGGYDLKPSAGMRKMKKDMGGAAISIALARLIMKADLPVHLKLLVPAVENLVSGNAFKPGDVINTRKGMSVEIDNTDAEGRLVLCDALTYASETNPEIILNFATLTGACRVALGQDLPGMYSNNDELAEALKAISFKIGDPVWQMPLYFPYMNMLSSSIADTLNSSPTGFAGSVTAALYLSHFVDLDKEDWVHFDVYAWSDETRSYLQKGADAQTLRAAFHYLSDRYS